MRVAPKIEPERLSIYCPVEGVDDPVNLTDIKEEDLPKEKLQQALLRHDGAVYLVKNE